MHRKNLLPLLAFFALLLIGPPGCGEDSTGPDDSFDGDLVGFEEQSVYSVVANSQANGGLLAGTWSMEQDFALHRSLDSGENWLLISGAGALALTTDSNAPERILRVSMSEDNQPLFQWTTDFAENWTSIPAPELSAGSGVTDIYTLHGHLDHLFITLTGWGGSAVMFSDDGGENWDYFGETSVSDRLRLTSVSTVAACSFWGQLQLYDISGTLLDSLELPGFHPGSEVFFLNAIEASQGSSPAIVVTNDSLSWLADANLGSVAAIEQGLPDGHVFSDLLYDSGEFYAHSIPRELLFLDATPSNQSVYRGRLLKLDLAQQRWVSVSETPVGVFYLYASPQQEIYGYGRGLFRL